MTTALDIANRARNSIGKYCITDCGAKCCQRGYLLLMTDKEVEIICSNRKTSLMKKEILKPSKNGFLMYDLVKKPCRNFDKKTNKCKIHINSSRPLVCRDYPIFLVKDYVMMASDCPAVQNGLLKDFEEEFKKIGIKII